MRAGASSHTRSRGGATLRLSIGFLSLALLSLTLLSHLPSTTLAVRPNDFKKCSDSSFCRRLRRLSSYAAAVDANATSSTQAFQSPYWVPSTPSFDAARAELVSPINSALYPEVNFELRFGFHADGTARVRMDQVGERYGGWKRYDEAAKWAYDGAELKPAGEGSVNVEEKAGSTVATFGPAGRNTLEIQHKPFKATFSRNGESQVVLNDRGLLHMEHYRPKPGTEDKAVEGSENEGEGSLVFQKRQAIETAGFDVHLAQAWANFEEHDSGEWAESWTGKQDSKPKGPEALSLDISFPGKKYLFGLPEHASPLNLRSTKGQAEGDFTDPYRLMNTDVFEYDYDSPMALYGSVPIVHAQSAHDAVSAFFLSGSETWVDIDRADSTTRTHWMAESGILDLLVLLEDTPAKNIETFTALVGRTTAPQTFALGYHQCRWNYLSDSDVLNVQSRFDKEDIPMDVMWLDIEYSKDHMYGVWDELNFPNPEKMIDGLDERGRKLVIIIDPHLKRTSSYWLYNEAQSNEVLVRSPDGKDEYEGWCWSGSASWLDMFNPKALEWWAKQFRLIGKGKDAIVANRRNLHVWNDMNEPAIFNGPEVTSPKDVLHHGGWEHRDIHNINGILFHAATFHGLKDREGTGKLERRPFVLSRSWWTGTQKYGAIWTGDNLGTWEHLAVSVPMILSNNVAGMSFCGADIGGFFGNPSPEMLVRWYQAGIFEPFFRAHAHIDTKRREPYLLDEPYRSTVRELIRLRYKLLPVWVTAFREASDEGSGLPVLRPQFVMFPHDEAGFAIDDQYYIGDSGLLVKPAVQEGASSVRMYLSDDRPYYNFFTHEVYRAKKGKSADRTIEVSAPLPAAGGGDGAVEDAARPGAQMPLLVRGGSIVPMRERVRRAAELGWRDPVTLIIALDAAGSDGGIRAEGLLYLDDGQTYHYKDGAFIWRRFTFETLPRNGESADGPRHVLRSRDETANRRATAAESTETGVSVPSSSGALPPYDAQNEFAKAIADVRVEKVVILGLEGEIGEVRIKGDVLPRAEEADSEEAGIVSSWSAPGVNADGSRTKEGKGSKKAKERPDVARKVVVRDPRALLKGDWDLEFY